MRRTLVLLTGALLWTFIGFGSQSAAAGASCNRECLIKIADAYVAALVDHDPTKAPLAKQLKYSDQGVFLPVGDGVWRTIDRQPLKPHLYVTDVEKGQVAYLGIAQEGSLPAVYSMRLKVQDRSITEAEVFLARQGSEEFEPENWSKVDFAADALLPETSRISRERTVAVVNSYFDSIVNGTADSVSFDPDCVRVENGRQTTSVKAPNAPELSKLNCQQQFELGAGQFHTAITDRRILAVDVERGLVAVSAFFETNGSVQEVKLKNGTKITMPPKRLHPHATQIFEVMKLRNGRIWMIKGMFEGTLYGAQSGWAEGSHPHEAEKH